MVPIEMSLGIGHGFEHFTQRLVEHPSSNIGAGRHQREDDPGGGIQTKLGPGITKAGQEIELIEQGDLGQGAFAGAGGTAEEGFVNRCLSDQNIRV